MPRRINPQQQKRTSLARAFTKFTPQYAEIVDRSHDVLLIQEKSRLGIWIVADVPLMAALQFSNPVQSFVHMESNNFSWLAWMLSLFHGRAPPPK